VNVGSPLVADRQAPKASQPGQRAFHDPAIAAQFLAALDALARDPHLDVPLRQSLPTPQHVVRLICMQLRWSFAWPTAPSSDRRNRVQQRLEVDAVMAVGRSQQDRERNAVSLDDQMPLRARFALVGGIRTDLLAPLFAGILALSRLARLQSIWSAAPSWSSKAWWSRSQTPASCQSRNRRQQVTPLPQPISSGSISHGMPDLRTKMIPVKAARSGTRGRPPFGFGGSGGSSGSMISHNSSETSGLAIMPHPSTAHGFERHSKSAADKLVSQRLLLEEDAERYVAAAESLMTRKDSSKT
jgi:hypothetical protein